ncbi:MAG: glycosyl hydrolase family 95 catalytic domain-containing protein [Janthinobacterium lividum]
MTASPLDEAVAANQLFLNQKPFDPWRLTSTDTQNTLPAYFSDGAVGNVVGPLGKTSQQFQAGLYRQGELATLPPTTYPSGHTNDYPTTDNYRQKFDLQTGSLTTRLHEITLDLAFTGQKPRNWPQLWQTSDIVISGDPEAQQVTHANLFYLLSSTYPGSDHSIPPMGLSSNIYGGHIFWDAEVWMMPALLVQHPDYAKSIIDYRFKTLGQAKKNARMHRFAGAEYAWESADTGAEMAPAEFAQERHITADVGWAAWQYYLWTGDKAYLAKEGWPVLSATAAYWVSRVSKGGDGKYHITKVLSPDETAGVVSDDAYTNAVVQANLRAAVSAAKVMGQAADPRWASIADNLYFPFDKTRGIPAENDTPMTDRFGAKQADTLLLIHPLTRTFDPQTAGKMLDFYTAHTIKNGPAMTASMQAIVAAKLGRGQESLDQFHDSYRPFERGPWDAFAEKRTSNRVYFCTGMGGCLQSVLYGFAGLQVAEAGQKTGGTKIAGDGDVSLYADPHLPPGWGGLTVKGVRFHGKSYDVVVTSGNKVTVTPK